MKTESSPSALEGRQLRERKRRKYDFDLDGSDSEDEKVSQSKRGSRRKGPAATVRRPRKSAKLASFVNMPLDILHEIFGHLHPYDLLKLSRATKDFRRILLHKSAISTWRASFAHVPGLPECPPEMSEPCWANLVFSPHCHYCLSSGVRNVEWRFRMRICSKCAPHQFIETYLSPSMDELYSFLPGGFGEGGITLPDLRYLVPSREGKKLRRMFMRKDLIEFRDEYMALKDEEARNAFIDEKRNAIERLNMHSVNCVAWSHNLADDRSDELERLRKERKHAILKKLEGLGYKKDIDSMRFPDSLAMDRQTFVNKPQRLTDRVWNNIEPAAIRFMEEMREKRLHREHENLIISRKAYAGQFLHRCKNELLPSTELFPEPPDFCDFPQIRAILSQPSDIQVTVTSFDAISPWIPEMFRSWRRDRVLARFLSFLATDEILSLLATKAVANASMHIAYPKGTKEMHERIPFLNPSVLMLMDCGAESQHLHLSSEYELLSRLQLATTVFICEACVRHRNIHDYLEDWNTVDPYADFGFRRSRVVKTLFFPQVMGHPCLTRKSARMNFLHPIIHDRSTFLNDSRFERQKWDGCRLRLDRPAAAMAALIVQLVGLDPLTATVEEMDALPVRLRCVDCTQLRRVSSRATAQSDSEDEDSPDVAMTGFRSMVFRWRAAVRHQVECHTLQGIDPSYFLLAEGVNPPRPSIRNLTLITDADALMAEVRQEEERIERETAEIWCCTHCRDLPEESDGDLRLPKLLEHLKERHNQGQPILNQDYFKHFSALDLMNSYDCTVFVDIGAGRGGPSRLIL